MVTWVQVNIAVLNQYRKQIGASGTAFYLQLAEIAGDNRVVSMAAEALATAMEVSVETVRVNMRRLKRAGLVKITPNFGADGGLTGNTYELLI